VPLKKRAIKHWKDFNIPLSYVPGDTRDRFIEAHNVYVHNGRTFTRPGCELLSATPGDIAAMTYYKEGEDQELIYVAKNKKVFERIRTSGSVETKTAYTYPNFDEVGMPFSSVAAFGRLFLANEQSIYQYQKKNGLENDTGYTFAKLGIDIDGIGIETTSVVKYDVGGVVFSNGTQYQVGFSLYDPTHGFETKIIPGSSYTYTTGQIFRIEMRATKWLFPETFGNPFVTHGRFYIKNLTTASDWSFVSSSNLRYALNLDDPTLLADHEVGAVCFQEEPYCIIPISNTITPPDNDAWEAGAQHIAAMNNKLVIFYKDKIVFSKTDDYDGPLPEVPDVDNFIYAHGDGDIVGGAIGYYDDSKMEPYVAIFKRNSCSVWSKIDGIENNVLISDHIGCVSKHTIQVVNGDVFFMSEHGWAVMSKGRIIMDDQGNPILLGDADIGSIFSDPGFFYGINKSMMHKFHAVYDQRLKQYITFIAESGDRDVTKAMPFMLKTKGFARWEFLPKIQCSAYGADYLGISSVFLGCDSGIYKLSVDSKRRDWNAATSAHQKIPAHVIFTWLAGGDYDATYNFYELCLEAINAIQDLVVSAAIDFTRNYTSIETIDNTMEGFQLDVDSLDTQGLADERLVKRYRTDIHKCGLNIAVKIKMSEDLDYGNLELVSAQIHFNKNGNRN
jgi:hypothetical protein